MIFDRQQQHLLLEGKEYTPEDIARFIAEGAENTPSALWDLYLFLNEWFNDSPVITVHTSGSTGTPKELIVRKDQMMQSARLTCEFLNLKQGESALLCMNLRYIGAMMLVVRALVAGLDLIVRPASGHPLSDVKQPLRFAAMVPLQVYNTLRTPEEKERLKQTEILIIGGGAIDEALETKIKSLPGAVYSTYGMTETLSHIALRRLNGTAASERYYPFSSVNLSLSPENTLVIDAPLVCDGVLQTNDIARIYPDKGFIILGQETNEIFNVPISATVAADHDRTFAVEVIDRESNAVEGKHYKILSNTVTIKAGERSTNLEVQGIYDNLEINDSLGFALRLVIPETEQWGLYGTEAKVVMQKIRPFDIKNFTGYCVVSSTYFASYLNNLELRLVTSDIVEGKENTIAIHGLYYDGYDTEITFNREDVQEPLVEMDEQLCASTATAFGTIYGDGKLLMNQPTAYTSYFSTNENFVLQYVTLSVNNRDGSSYGTVGTFVNVIEWISEAEAEKLKEQGY